MRTPLTHSGTMGSVPSTFATGYKYAGLGYTTAFDAAPSFISGVCSLLRRVASI